MSSTSIRTGIRRAAKARRRQIQDRQQGEPGHPRLRQSEQNGERRLKWRRWIREPMWGAARITAFKGEQAITSAMIDLVEGKKNVVGYVLGHREPPIAGHAAEPYSVDGSRSGSAQPDRSRENRDRERKHQVPGTETVRGQRNLGRSENCRNRRTTVRFFRSGDEVAAGFLGEAGAHSPVTGSIGEDTKAAWVSQ